MSALGLFPHTGWTWLVRVEDGSVVARERVEAVSVLAAELYHLMSEYAGDRVKRFATLRESCAKATVEAVRPHVGNARAGVVLGKSPALPPFEKIIDIHPMIHTAEGELWRALFAEALDACGVKATRAMPPKMAHAKWLATEGKRIGAPWNSELKLAALAAKALD